MMEYDVVVVGGGSAGMAAALKASENKASVLLIERDCRLGGILNQCVHNGFGLKYFKEELTGPEYANAFVEKIKKSNVHVLLNTTVLNISKTLEVKTISPDGLFKIQAKAIVLTMGCRERPAASISLCGTRPAGVLTAGAAQKLINIQGKMIGKNIVIVGSGDIGLIMARRLHFEGANVLGVYEIMPTPSGLKRNICQCLNDYDIPLHLSETVVEVVGQDRVEGVYVAKVNPDFSFDMSTKRLIECDTILLSIGLTPETDLVQNFIKMNQVTNGASVNEYYETSQAGIFSCGNVLHVHDIVDNVTMESEETGKNAALYSQGKLHEGKEIVVSKGKGLRYVVPETVFIGSGIATFKFRVDKIYKNAKIVAKSKGEVIRERQCNILLPAEMENIIIDKSRVKDDLEISIEEV